MPGQGSQELLLVDPTTSPPIAHPSGTYPWVTKANWFLSCDPTLLDGELGEGFIARSPEGLIYHFNKMVHGTWVAPIVWARGDGGGDKIDREQIRIYATSVEDRHGNFVHYNWTGTQLTSITANDGRTITITYGPIGRKITSVTDGTRTWNYGYTCPTGPCADDPHGVLTSVTLPDNSQWQINFSAIGQGFARYDNTTVPPQPTPPGVPFKVVHDRALICSYMRVLLDPPSNTHTAWIVHPSGARGDFTFQIKRHGRAAVTQDCEAAVKGDHDSEYNQAPPRFDVHSLIAKTISGPGLPPYVWTYNYNDNALPIGSYGTCAPGQCTKWVEVTAPDGSKTKYIYGIKFEVDESQLLATEIRDASNVLLRSETSTFVPNAAPWSQPFPDKIRQSTQPRTDSFLAERLRPQVEHAISQDGTLFTSHINTFDSFAHPTSVSKYSSLGTSKTEQTSYLNDISRWVIGLPTTTTDQASGVVISQTVYDGTQPIVHDLPLETWSFGRRLKRFTYWPDGNVNTVTDENNHTITVSDYKRGVPRYIQFPTGSPNYHSSAVVNDLGGIDSVTDELGNTTVLHYDIAGRLQSITYPSDSLGWNTTNFTFAQITQCEFGTGEKCTGGLDVGHWRQTISTGNGKKTTYFDALWRPVLSQDEDIGNAATKRYSAHGYDFGSRESFSGYPVASLSTLAGLTTGTHNAFDGWVGRPHRPRIPNWVR